MYLDGGWEVVDILQADTSATCQFTFEIVIFFIVLFKLFIENLEASIVTIIEINYVSRDCQKMGTVDTELKDLVATKVKEGDDLLQQVHSHFASVDGSQKLERRIRSEIKFLLKVF